MKFDIPKNAISDVIFRLAHRETVFSGLLAFNDTKLEFKVVKNDTLAKPQLESDNS